MLGYILKRAISLIVSLCLASIIIFSVVEIAPGDPASFMLGINAQEDTITALRAELGLDQPKLSGIFLGSVVWSKVILEHLIPIAVQFQI